MAIALLDAHSNTSTSKTPSLAYTCSAGTNRLLLMICAWVDDANLNRTLSSIGYGAVTPTLAANVDVNPAGNHHCQASIYYVLDTNIPAGLQTATYDLNLATDLAILTVVSFEGVKQAAQETSNTDSGVNGAGSIVVNITNGALMIGGIGLTPNAGSAIAWGAGQNEMADIGAALTCGSDYEIASSGGNNTQTATGDGSANFGYVVASFAPFSLPADEGNFFNLF